MRSRSSGEAWKGGNRESESENTWIGEPLCWLDEGFAETPSTARRSIVAWFGSIEGLAVAVRFIHRSPHQPAVLYCSIFLAALLTCCCYGGRSRSNTTTRSDRVLTSCYSISARLHTSLDGPLTADDACSVPFIDQPPPVTPSRRRCHAGSGPQQHSASTHLLRPDLDNEPQSAVVSALGLDSYILVCILHDSDP